MEKEDIARLRENVPYTAVLEDAAFSVDVRESTRSAPKYRRGDEIVIVIHEGRGWFDPLSDRKGDVFALASHLHGGSFRDALDRIATLVNFRAAHTPWCRPRAAPMPVVPIGIRWEQRRNLSVASPTWLYLNGDRWLPASVLDAVIAQEAVRDGPFGSMWAKHADQCGRLTGWEEPGPDWRGFSSGGAKQLFRFGSKKARRICVTEAAIDAMSLAAIEEMKPDTLYVSTGGGWSPLTAQALETLASQRNTQLIAATDNNVQGEVFADRIRQMAYGAGCDFSRLKSETTEFQVVGYEMVVGSIPLTSGFLSMVHSSGIKFLLGRRIHGLSP